MNPEYLPSAALARRIAWFAVGLAATALLLTAGLSVFSHPVGWVSWVLPLIIMVSAGMTALNVWHSHPRVARGLTLITLGVALIVIVTEVTQIAHR